MSHRRRYSNKWKNEEIGVVILQVTVASEQRPQWPAVVKRKKKVLTDHLVTNKLQTCARQSESLASSRSLWSPNWVAWPTVNSVRTTYIVQLRRFDLWRSNGIVCSPLPAYYIQQCHKSDPNVDVCLKQSANKFARFVQKGIPELEIEEVSIIWTISL